VASRRGGDAQPRLPFLDVDPVPRRQTIGAPEADALELVCRFLRRHDGNVLVELFLHEFVEMVFVHMRQHDEIDRRQLLEIQGGIRKAFGRDAIAEVDVVALVQEIGIRQYREALVADQHRRGADELDGAIRFDRRGAGLELQGTRGRRGRLRTCDDATRQHHCHRQDCASRHAVQPHVVSHVAALSSTD